MNADRMAKIDDVKQQLGLDQATADKVIKAVQSKRVAGTMEMFRKSGELTLDKVLEAASDGVDVSDFMGEDSRMGLYRTEVERLLSNGECAYNNDTVRVELVDKLKLAEKRLIKDQHKRYQEKLAEEKYKRDREALRKMHERLRK